MAFHLPYKSGNSRGLRFEFDAGGFHLWELRNGKAYYRFYAEREDRLLAERDALDIIARHYIRSGAPLVGRLKKGKGDLRWKNKRKLTPGKYLTQEKHGETSG